MIFDDIEPFIIRFPASIREVLDVLNRSGLRIVFALGSGSECIGAMSDGDVRRALLAGSTLDDDALSVLRRDILTATSGHTVAQLTKLSGERGVQHIPFLDDAGKIQAVFVRDPHIDPGDRENLVVIMAGGKGLRLRPLTNETPKPMIEIAGKPILRRIIEKLAKEGFRNFVISVNYLGEKIEGYFGDGEPLGVKIRYIRESEPLGTAGSLTLLEFESEVPILVVNGDILMEASAVAILEHHVSRMADLTVVAKVVETEVPYGVIETEGLEIRSIVEKPAYRNLVSAGVYVIGPGVFPLIPSGRPVDMPELIDKVASGGRAQVFPLFEDWVDVGRPSDLRSARRYYDDNREG